MNAFQQGTAARFMRMLLLLATAVTSTAHAQVTGNTSNSINQGGVNQSTTAPQPAVGETFGQPSGSYTQTNLVSDGAIPALTPDPNLVNGWGIAFNPTGPVWVANNGTGIATAYDGTGAPQSVHVKIPAAAGSPTGTGTPTGIVVNPTTDFQVTANGTSNASRFIFATEDGLIAAWAPNLDPNNAIKVVDMSGANGGAVFKGLTMSTSDTGNVLYATDFANARVVVFNGSFTPVSMPSGAFVDPTIPAGFAPFGIQAINGNIYVSYAKQDAQKHDDVPGPGLGFISVFAPGGQFIQRVVSQGVLNAPWGMALAPSNFGPLSNRLLVGNFGDGTINAFDFANGNLVGTVMSANNQKRVIIDGLWGIAFGNGFSNQPVNTLFFASGPNSEAHGLFGRIDVAPGNNGTNGIINGLNGSSVSNIR